MPRSRISSTFIQAVKSVLVMAGALKRGFPDVDEDLTLIRALVDSNVPKFLADDLPLFEAIVKVRVTTRLILPVPFQPRAVFGDIPNFARSLFGVEDCITLRQLLSPLPSTTA